MLLFIITNSPIIVIISSILLYYALTCIYVYIYASKYQETVLHFNLNNKGSHLRI